VKKREISKNLVMAHICTSLRYTIPIVHDAQICKWWRIADKHPRYKGRCKVMVRLLLGQLPGINYSEGRNCWMCKSPSVRDNVLHFLTGCQHIRLLPLRESLRNKVSVCRGDDVNFSYEVMMHVCLNGDVDDESSIDIMNIIYAMYKIRLEMSK
jgi:hypothetical protein